MATAKLTKLWKAYFPNGASIFQNKDDRYSKHDDNAEHNPSAFRDILDYPLDPYWFTLEDETKTVAGVDLSEGKFIVGPDYNWFSLESEPLTDRKLIYFRDINWEQIDGVTQDPYVVRYAIGYEGKNPEGKIEKKVLYIDG